MKTLEPSSSGCLKYDKNLIQQPNALCNFCCNKTFGTPQQQSFQVGKNQFGFRY